MKPEEQRIDIAKACGWKQLFKGEHDRYVRFSPPPTRKPEYKYGSYIHGLGHTNILKKEYLVDELPDYLNDLNAMNEAEKTIVQRDRSIYWNALMKSVGPDGEVDLVDDYGEQSTSPPTNGFSIVHATAKQRAEAFLKTLNLWNI